MAILSQDQIAQQMLAQLRILDPSISAEVGTPERKIIDTVAQAMAETQVDLNLLGGALDLSAKFGSDLDAFVGLFGFGRQTGAHAVGFVTFSRTTPAAYNIVVPRGTQVQAVDSTLTTVSFLINFQTTTAVTLAAGATEVIAPIQALLTGDIGNLAANTITAFANLGAPPLGITGVTNETPTTGGDVSESDAELKVRFKNTIFRNLSGTQDQYLALAVATQFSTKATVIGPISRFSEYIQVPYVDDSESEAATSTFVGTATTGSPTLTSVGVVSGGIPLVTNPITGTGITAGTTILDIEGTTYTLSLPYTGAPGVVTFVATTGEPALGGGGGFPGVWTTSQSTNPYAKYIYKTVPNFVSNGTLGVGTTFYRQDSDFSLNVPPFNLGDTFREFTATEIPNPSTTPYKPNVSFFNVYEGGDPTVTMPTPGAVVLLEYSYMSAESRNDYIRNVLNCVDVYVDGENPTNADAVIPTPPGGFNLFTNNPTDMFYASNFRRVGQPTVSPSVSHIFTGLFWQPVINLPDQIIGGTNTYLLNTHYWVVEDKTLLGGTIRSRNGIEWDPTAAGMASADPVGGPYTGPTITNCGVNSLTIGGYSYDKNIADLQVALDGSKQVTTDVLAHRAVRRYFKLDLTVVYNPGVGAGVTNAAIQSALQTFFSGQYFGTTIQMTDLLLVVRNTSGVQNVRWSDDISLEASLARVTECDDLGNPLAGPVIFNADFYLLDSELPALPDQAVSGDTLPGLILRPRAQNTFEFF